MNKISFGCQLQRLVDGELDHSERCQFLARATIDPTAWRVIALAFVERQVLDEAMSKSPVWTDHNDIEQFPKRALSQNNATTNDSAFDSILAVPETSLVKARNKRVGWWAAMSACLLIGLALGNWTERSSWNVLKSTGDSITKPNDSATGMTHADLIRTIPLSEALERSVVPVPIVFRRELMKQGYLVNELALLTKVQLPNGETIEMPVRQVDVRFLGNATFQ